MRFTQAFPVVTCLLFLGLTSACAPTVRSAGAAAAKGAIPAGVETGLRATEDARTRARLAAVLGTPEMQQAIQQVSNGLTQGAVKGLSSDELNDHLNKLVSQLVRTLMSELSRGVDSAMDGATSRARQQQIEQVTAGIVSSVMRATAHEIPQTLAPAMRQAMLDDIAPAMREMMAKDLGPGLAAVVRSPDFKAAMRQMAREVARDAVLGSNDGLAVLAEEKRKNRDSGMPLGAIGSFFATRTWLLGVLGVALVLGIPILWLAHDRRRTRAYRDEAERRNARVAALLGAMEAAPGGTWSSPILKMLRTELIEETTAPKTADSSRRHLRPPNLPPVAPGREPELPSNR